MSFVTQEQSIYLPIRCPRCNTELRWDGVDLVCDYENESQLAYRFISVLGETDGAGWSLYNKVIELYKINSFNDLVEFLKAVKLTSVVDKIRSNISGTATQNKCISVIEKIVRYKVDPVRFLVACNIGGVSWTTAKSLMENYSDFINDVKDINVDWIKVSNIRGFGYSTVVALQSAESRIRSLSESLSFKEVSYETPSETKFKVAITGSLSIKRSDFNTKLAQKGIVQSGNFKEIKYLITNNPSSTSSKMRSAIENGVEIISEEEFTKKYLES